MCGGGLLAVVDWLRGHVHRWLLVVHHRGRGHVHDWGVVVGRRDVMRHWLVVGRGLIVIVAVVCHSFFSICY